MRCDSAMAQWFSHPSKLAQAACQHTGRRGGAFIPTRALAAIVLLGWLATATCRPWPQQGEGGPLRVAGKSKSCSIQLHHWLGTLTHELAREHVVWIVNAVDFVI